MLDKELLKLLGKDKKYLYYITIINIFGMLANVSIIALICLILHNVSIFNRDINFYIITVISIILLLIIKVLCNIISTKIKNNLGSKVKVKLRDEAYQKLLRLGLTSDNNEKASLTQLIIEGIEQIDLYYSSFIPSFFYAMISPIILFIICLILQWQVSLVLIICLPLIPMSIIMVSKWAKKIFAKYWDKYTNMGNDFLDSVSGMKELKIADYDETKQKQMNENSEEFRKITMKVLVMQLCSLTIIDTVAFGGAGIAICFAINGALNGLNPFIALFLILICSEFFLPMRALASSFHISMNGATSGRKIREFLAIDEPTYGSLDITNISKIELKDLSFSYNNEKVVLNNINMTFTKGINSVVGESGSGKSTIVSLVLGSYLPTKGELLINNHNVRDYKQDSYLSKLTHVSYNTFIFNRSIKDNFKLVNENITDEEIYKYLKLVNLSELVEQNGGLDYVILEDSQNISGGQKQRLAFAINMSLEKDLYIFDEATSNIDIESEKIIMDNIYKLATNKIVIIISHRLANVVKADKIFYLKDSNLTEEGTHEELINKKQDYYNTYTLQMSLENGYKEVHNEKKCN